MFRRQLIFDKYFWQIVEFFDSLDRDLSLETVLSRLKVTEFDLYRAIALLEHFNYRIKVKHCAGGVVISPPDSKIKLQSDFTLAQWVSLQAQIPFGEESIGQSFHDTLVLKMAAVEQQDPQNHLHNILKKEDHRQEVLKRLLIDESQNMLNIHQALEQKNSLLLSFKGLRKSHVFPYRPVYVGGELSIVGENIESKCLVCLSIKKIMHTKIMNKLRYVSNFSRSEVDDFLYALRAVNGSEVRLILKIFDEKKVDTRPPFHFHGSPYMTTNIGGELIWASSVEVSDRLFDWLLDIRDGAEIIDPIGLKRDFLKYCNEKLKKVKSI